MPIKSKIGFTLIELLVVITIIGIVGTIAVPSYFRSAKYGKYENAVTEIVSLIKEARTNAISGKFTGTVDNYTASIGGYGVFIDKSSDPQKIILFTNTGADIYDDTMDTLISTYTLPAEINIQTMTGTQATDYTNSSPTNTSFSQGTIIFKPPQGETFLNENAIDKALFELSIVLERYDRNKSKTLKINKISGFVETK